MIKIVIKTCSCFIDRAVWFMHLSDTVPPYCYFDSTINYSYKNRTREFLDNYFIKEVRTTKTLIDDDNDYELLSKITIIKSCFDCFKFHAFLSTVSTTSLLDDFKCRFVKSDMTTFSNDFDSDIFVGNSQFVVENTFYSQEQKELLFNGKKNYFIRQPLHKFCFVSLQKNVISFFAQHVKKLRMIILKKHYMFFLELSK